MAEISFEGAPQRFGNELEPESEKPNAFLGEGALVNAAAKSEGNTAFGIGALESITTGSLNTAVGWGALNKLKTASGNTAVGEAAGAVTTNASNTFFGNFAGFENTSGSNNTYIGQGAGYTNKTGPNNTYLGRWAGHEASGEASVFIGPEAGLVAAGENVMLGCSAGKETTGTGNVFLGTFAGMKEVAVSNKLIIANNFTTPLIAGTLSGTQALGFYGVTPVAKAGAITTPAETVASLKTAVDAIRVAIKGIGITA